ncbi:uncharacterized protein LACBIDRAFT_325546 [Laccaria bicolor S238N-H82]|uniref:Predicted protein n=1 Tax=Laccaria bicolor (strain S238N-H82 / ATCC MYA-4686) TaxID=486041 RepID=B0D5F6_LACBS|nr:uncharacterized protein LACBIDRAFT_325546 [Laccaria bicolor S238N-H82]EDR09762.1 predicted protein [Laccaria bicolor S238N-H82]|eukprot:XP_001879147.1 predicted protein [Laccaria bicolor S238N-H82]
MFSSIPNHSPPMASRETSALKDHKRELDYCSPGGIAGSRQHTYFLLHFDTQGATLPPLRGPSIPGVSSQPRMPPNHSYNQHIMALAPIPTDIPLPHSSDKDLTHGLTIATATGHAPASFVAGSRHIECKKNEVVLHFPWLIQVDQSLDQDWSKDRKRLQSWSFPVLVRSFEVLGIVWTGLGLGLFVLGQKTGLDRTFKHYEKPIAKRGRCTGAGNYTEGDLSQLLALIEDELPIGQRGWKKVHERFAKWAKKNNRPERDCKSIETKYKQLIKPGKPTGSGKRPETVTKALKIEQMINERAGTRDLNDSDFDNTGEVEIVGGPVTNDSTLHAVTPRRMHTSAPTLELVQTLSKAFDLATQQSHKEDRASRSMQTTQFLTISQQLRDANATIESLRNEVSRLCNRFHDAEQARDCAELKLELMGMNAPASEHREHHTSSSSSEKENIDPTTSAYTNSGLSAVRSHSRWSSGVDFTPPTFFSSVPFLSTRETPPVPSPSHTSLVDNNGLLVTPHHNSSRISYIVSPVHVPGPKDNLSYCTQLNIVLTASYLVKFREPVSDQLYFGYHEEMPHLQRHKIHLACPFLTCDRLVAQHWIPVALLPGQIGWQNAQSTGVQSSPVQSSPLDSHWTASHFPESSPSPVDYESTWSHFRDHPIPFHHHHHHPSPLPSNAANANAAHANANAANANANAANANANAANANAAHANANAAHANDARAHANDAHAHANDAHANAPAARDNDDDTRRRRRHARTTTTTTCGDDDTRRHTTTTRDDDDTRRRLHAGTTTTTTRDDDYTWGRRHTTTTTRRHATTTTTRDNNDNNERAPTKTPSPPHPKNDTPTKNDERPPPPTPARNGDEGPAAPPFPSTLSPYHYLLSSPLPLPSTLSPLHSLPPFPPPPLLAPLSPPPFPSPFLAPSPLYSSLPPPFPSPAPFPSPPLFPFPFPLPPPSVT